MNIKYALAAMACGFATTALATGPQYVGTMCPIDGGVRITVETDTAANAMLIYPTPPGGGYFMAEIGPGQFVHDIQGLSVGDAVSFSFVLQNPQQYNYPPHGLVVAGECVEFERNDVTPPPPRGSPRSKPLRGSPPQRAARRLAGRAGRDDADGGDGRFSRQER